MIVSWGHEWLIIFISSRWIWRWINRVRIWIIWVSISLWRSIISILIILRNLKIPILLGSHINIKRIFRRTNSYIRLTFLIIVIIMKRSRISGMIIFLLRRFIYLVVRTCSSLMCSNIKTILNTVIIIIKSFNKLRR